jgi:hypothetical protein
MSVSIKDGNPIVGEEVEVMIKDVIGEEAIGFTNLH